MGKQEAVTLFRCDNRAKWAHDGKDPDAGISVVAGGLDTPDGWLEVWGLAAAGPLTYCSLDCAIEALRDGRTDGKWDAVERCEDCQEPLGPELSGQGFGCCTDCMAASEDNLRPAGVSA